MEHPGFFQKAGPFKLSEICDKLGLENTSQDDPLIKDVKGIKKAGPADLTFLEDNKLIPHLEASKAALCLTKPEFEEKIPEGKTVLYHPKPHQAFVEILSLFYPEAMRSQTSLSSSGMIDETAVIEDGAVIEPGAIIGREAQIGSGTRIAAGTVIGYRCYIGRDCMIGPNATLTHSLVGNNVTIHAGVAIGQDGFGYLMGPGGHKKIPQIGRVIIQDSVEIGANSTIDRGALEDTIIGEGTKIDNLVQIGHNVVIGSHAVIVSQTGISGSVKLGNYVVLGGQCGVVGHIEIGDGAQIAATSNVNKNVPPNVKYGGTPAKPMKQWFREIVALERLAAGKLKE